MNDSQSITSLIETFPYIGTFITLALGGTIIPLPEEVLLLLVGYMATVGYYSLLPMVFVAVAAVLVGDSLIFTLARRHNRYSLLLLSKFNQAKLASYKQQMRLHTGKTLFVLRFVVGLRFFGPIVAGIMNISWLEFIFFDALAALIFVPLLLLLGYYFPAKVAWFVSTVEAVRHALFVGLVISGGLLVSYFFYRKFFSKSVTSDQ